jgi:hypothetical protein
LSALAAAAAASQDFTWPDVVVMLLGVILVLGLAWLILR